MISGSPTVLIAEDDLVSAELYRTVLEAQEVTDIIIASDSREVMPTLREKKVDVILLDLLMPHISGKELLPEIVAHYPEVPVIILTGEDRVDTAVECMKIGAFDFMTKPVDRNRLVNSMSHAVKIRELEDEVQVLASTGTGEELRQPEAFDEIVTVSPSMMKTLRYVETIAPSPRAVLITGESGTGKELIARAVHRASRPSGRFVPVNVSGLDDTMFSDTLFGHTRGAFTGAEQSRKGLIEEAAGGTLFLDEIGDLEAAAQVKLLRLLQEQEYYPLGSDRPATSRARIVAATNADLRERQRAGKFRKDLYYRLMSHHVQVPPLRNRPDDIVVLAETFAEESAHALGKPHPHIPEEVFSLLKGYSFPGNVRELQSLIHDAVSRHGGGALPVSFFRDYLGEYAAADSVAEGRGNAIESVMQDQWNGALPTLQEAEDALITEALRRTGQNQSAAARLLGVSQSTLSRRLRTKHTPE